MKRVLAWAGVMALAACHSEPVYAHSWYDRECCSDSDCHMVSSDTIRHGPSGYVLPNGEIVQYGTERTSLDGEYHWCQWGDGKTIRPAGKPVCLYVPPGGV